MAGDDPLTELNTRIGRLRKELAEAEEAREALWRKRDPAAPDGARRGTRVVPVRELMSRKYHLDTILRQLGALQQPFTLSAARRAIGATDRTANRALKDLVREGRVKRLERGYYRVV